MADAQTVTVAAKELRTIATRYHRFQKNVQEFLEELHQVDQERLSEYREWADQWATKTIDGVRQISPVVFLRRVLVDRLLAGQKVTLQTIDEIRQRIEARDTDYFSDYPQFLDAIAALKETKKSPFSSWNPFSILFYIDYHFLSDSVRERLEQIATFLRSELELVECDYHLAGFGHNQNFGTDWCWLALYPASMQDHKNAYQVFLSIAADGFQYGVVTGSRVGKEERFEDSEPGDLDPSAILHSYRDRLPLFFERNRALEKASPPIGSTASANKRSHPLNVILYGPPGTGKTFSVQRRAIEIIEGTSVGIPDNEISHRFRHYQDQRRIEFVTFHPSYSYEEFVEGFRYDRDEKIPLPEDGVFKRLVKRAINPRSTPQTPDNAKIWKVSLGGKEDPEIFDRSMKNDEVAIGWLPSNDLIGVDETGIRELFEQNGAGKETTNIRTVNFLVNEMRIGDYVAVLKDQKTIRAIGVIKGDYVFKGKYEKYRHIRPVEWLDRRDHDIYAMNESTNLTLQTIYPLNRIPLQSFVALLPPKAGSPEPYVLIIDEINRGNLPRIFGELITLLEPDKRKNASNEQSVRLAYSQEMFSVPENLHVIGTMNTADRSIALLDVALRRRFEFEEMMPNVSVIRSSLSQAAEEDPEGMELNPEQVELVCNVFTSLNRRITVLLDRDHRIGHSYFLGLRSMADLHHVFYRKVLPLLQEYFYNDRDRLTRLLGQWEPSAGKGFVAGMDAEYEQAFTGQKLQADEMPWEFHRYQVGEFEDALRETFAPA
jgi:5-methylcytosine-specific restriction protein B